MKPYYTYREITSKSEFTQYLKCRYKAYRQSKLAAFLKNSVVELEIEPYDLRAKHYGFFKVEGNTEHLVGGIRVINETESKYRNTLLEITRENLEDTTFLSVPLDYPFYYMLNLSRFKEQLLQICRDFRKKGKKVADTGRFFVLPSERSLKLLKFFELAIITNAFFIEKNDVGITTCYPKIARFHQIFGFKKIPRTDLEYINGLESLNLILYKEEIPSVFKDDISKMEATFRKHGVICYHPQRLGYYEPCESFKIQLRDGTLVKAA